MRISFGDNVKVLSNPETDKKNLSGKSGNVHGETVPSISGVDVIGEVKDDFALNVFFDDLNESFWFVPELLEFVDHAEGTVLRVGNVQAVRKADGSWEETTINEPKKWWRFWE